MWQTSNCSPLFIYLPQKDVRLSRPGWLPYSGRFTHISGHLSVASLAQDRESLPVKDRRSTTVPRNQPYLAATVVATSIFQTPVAMQTRWVHVDRRGQGTCMGNGLTHCKRVKMAGSTIDTNCRATR